jgi:hypothetical protein
VERPAEKEETEETREEEREELKIGTNAFVRCSLAGCSPFVRCVFAVTSSGETGVSPPEKASKPSSPFPFTLA